MTWIVRFNWSTGPEYLMQTGVLSIMIRHAMKFETRAAATLALFQQADLWAPYIGVTIEVVELPPKLERGDAGHTGRWQ